MDDHTSARELLPWLTGTALLLAFLRWLFKPMIKEVIRDAVGKELKDIKIALNHQNIALRDADSALEDIYNLLDAKLHINIQHRKRISIPALDPDLIEIG